MSRAYPIARDKWCHDNLTNPKPGKPLFFRTHFWHLEMFVSTRCWHMYYSPRSVFIFANIHIIHIIRIHSGALLVASPATGLIQSMRPRGSRFNAWTTRRDLTGRVPNTCAKSSVKASGSCLLNFLPIKAVFSTKTSGFIFGIRSGNHNLTLPPARTVRSLVGSFETRFWPPSTILRGGPLNLV